MNRRQFLTSIGVTAAAVVFLKDALHGTPPAAAAEAVGADLEAPFQAGDVFTIADRYYYDPVTRQKTSQLQRFIVTAVTDDAVTVRPRGPMSVDLRASRRRVTL